MKFWPHLKFVSDFISFPYTITDLEAPETLYYIPRGAKLNDVKNVVFSSTKYEKKKKISWNIKTKCVTEFYLQLGLRVWRIIPVIAWWAHKCQTFTLISIKIMKIDIFFLQGSGYLNTRKSFSIFMFVVMASGKCDHKYLTIVQEFKPPHIQKN